MNVEVCGCNHLRNPNCPKRNKIQIMHTVHNVTEDVDEFTSSTRIFFVTNKIIHGSLQGAVETEEVILQDWIQREHVSSAALHYQYLHVMTMRWGRALHAPAWAVSPSSVSCRRREHPDLPWLRVGQSPWPADPPDSEPETKPRKPGRSQTHVPERFPRSPVSFPKMGKKKHLPVIYIKHKINLLLQGDFLAERSLHRFERIFWRWSYFQIQMSKIPTTPCRSSASFLFCNHSSEEMQVFISLRYSSSAVDQTLVTHWSWPMNSITPEGPFIPLQPISESEVRIQNRVWAQGGSCWWESWLIGEGLD